jgi:hypothetical protein
MKSIIFSTEEVQAILDSRKSQFRKSFSKTQLKYFDYAQKLGEINSLDNLHENDFAYILQFSKYKTDNILYVKEKCVNEYPNGYCFKEDYKFEEWQDKNLTKEYCNELNARIFVKIKNIRVERLQDIKTLDFFGEGFRTRLTAPYMEGRDWFSTVWNKKAKDGYKWEDNPYVFVYEFKRLER